MAQTIDVSLPAIGSRQPEACHSETKPPLYIHCATTTKPQYLQPIYRAHSEARTSMPAGRHGCKQAETQVGRQAGRSKSLTFASSWSPKPAGQASLSPPLTGAGGAHPGPSLCAMGRSLRPPRAAPEGPALLELSSPWNLPQHARLHPAQQQEPRGPPPGAASLPPPSWHQLHTSEAGATKRACIKSNTVLSYASPQRKSQWPHSARMTANPSQTKGRWVLSLTRPTTLSYFKKKGRYGNKEYGNNVRVYSQCLWEASLAIEVRVTERALLALLGLGLGVLSQALLPFLGFILSAERRATDTTQSKR